MKNSNQMHRDSDTTINDWDGWLQKINWMNEWN